MNPSAETTPISATESTETPVNAPSQLRGRSAFWVETVAAGVAVRTVFMTDDQKLLEMPAVFPELSYALAQIDDLRRAVVQHFTQAAQVGAQVIAAQQAANPAAAQAEATQSQIEMQAESASA